MWIQPRLIAAPFPEDPVVVAFEATEGLCTVFEVTVDVASSDPDLAPADLLGTEALLVVTPVNTATNEGEEPRCFHGVVDRAEALERTDVNGQLYRLVLRPRLWQLDRRVRSRIFQNLDALQIIEQVVTDAGLPKESVAWPKLQLRKREYCVQWRESELAFVMRLLQEEGIFFWFEHDENGHVLHLGNAAGDHKMLPGDPVLPLRADELAGADGISRIRFRTRLGHDGYVCRDWNWEQPGGAQEGLQIESGEGARVRYEYPGWFATQPQGNARAGRRFDALTQGRYVLSGVSNCLRLLPGRRFELVDANPDFLCDDYLVTWLRHQYSMQAPPSPEGEAGEVGEAGDGGEAAPAPAASFSPSGQRTGPYEVSFEAQRWLKVPFSPPWITPRPRIWGTCAGVVTGPPGEEIHVDKFGRVRVKFFWDREGTQDDNSSCWVRVQQQNLTGSLNIPRVGWEVSVVFIDGDPDRPVVLQKMYNRDTMPPYTLPGNKTQGALESASSPGGKGTQGIRLQDANAGMGFAIAAVKDYAVIAGNDVSLRVKVDAEYEVEKKQTSLVGNDETVTVGSNQSIQVTANLIEGTALNKTVTLNTENVDVTKSYTVTVAGKREDQIGGQLNMIANKVVEVFNADHNRKVGALQGYTTVVNIAETVGGKKQELVGGGKITVATKGLSESFDAAKILSTGLHMIKTGKDIGISAGAAFLINAAGKIKEKVGGAFTVTAKKINITAASITFKGGGTVFELKGGKLEVDASKCNASGGPQLQLKGKIDYDTP
jgi:type VI secretion system secreted protein VgrG